MDLKREITEFRNRSEKAKEDQPKVIEELNNIKEQVKTLKKEEQRKVQETSSWENKLFQTQKKAEEAEKWIETAKKGKSGLIATTPPSTIINLTLEEEQRRKTRALHVWVTGVRETGHVEEDVKGILKQMTIPEPTHTRAWGQVSPRREHSFCGSQQKKLERSSSRKDQCLRRLGSSWEMTSLLHR